MIRTALRNTRQLSSKAWATYSRHSDTVCLALGVSLLVLATLSTRVQLHGYMPTAAITHALIGSFNISLVLVIILDRHLAFKQRRPVPISYSRWSLALAGPVGGRAAQ